MRAGRRPVKRLDLRDLRKSLEDHRVWCAVGKVIQPDDEAGAQHFELVPGEGGAIVDILVEVLLLPGNVEVTCRLAGAAGGRGVVTVPALGAEVLVAIPNGEIEWMPVLVAQLSANGVPNPTGQGPSTTTTVIMDTTVLIHDGTGGAESLAKLSELNAVVDHFDQHMHAYASSGGPALTSWPSQNVAGTPVDQAPQGTGTEVLLAK